MDICKKIYSGNPDCPKGPWKFIGDNITERTMAIENGCTAFSTMSFAYEPDKDKPEPIRYGSLWLDFDSKEGAAKSILAAKNFINCIMYRYGVLPTTMRYFISGGKGVHIEIPAEIFSGENGHPYLPQIHKMMLSFILNIALSKIERTIIDTSLYCMGKGKLLRYQNIQRPNGNYKVQVSATEFMEEEANNLIALTKAPRHDYIPTDAPAPTRMTTLYDAACSCVAIRQNNKNSSMALDSIMNCSFIQHCYDHQSELSEPEWWMMVGILMTCGEAARPIVHEFSLGHPEYCPQKTNEKIAFALKDARKFTCGAIRKLFPCDRDCKVRRPGDLFLRDMSRQTIAASSFFLKPEGVLYAPSGEADDGGILVCSPMKVLGKIRNANGCGWARVVEFTAPDGRVQRISIPMRDCIGRGETVRALLADYGLEIALSSKSQSLLLEYIQHGAPDSTILLYLNKIGWHGNTYVLPGAQFGQAMSESIHLETSQDSLHQTAGTLADWQRGVGRLCHGNPLVVFVVSYALTGPLLRLCGMEGGGVHIYGASSTGKTTCALVAGSVCGGGGNRGFLRQWRSTHNALESTAALHNDNLLVLDEVSQASAEVVSQVAYMLPNGQGRERMRADTSKRQALTWRLNFLSTGELTINDKIQETGKLRAMAGQEVRVIDLPIDAGCGTNIFQTTHGEEDSASLSQKLAFASTVFYGTALRAFLEKLCDDIEGHEKLLLGAINAFVSDNVPTGASGQVKRVARKFGMIAAAGELAITWGIFPFAKGEARTAVVACFSAWLTQRGGHGDLELSRVLKRIQDHFVMEGSRYVAADMANGHQFVRLAGYRWQKEGEHFFLMLGPVFEELTRGTNRKLVMGELLERGWLLRNANGKLTETKSIGGRNVRGLVFCPSAWEGLPLDAPQKIKISHGEIY